MKFNNSFALLFLMQLIILVVYHFVNKSTNVGILIALFIPTFVMGIHIILSLLYGKGLKLLENQESMNTNAYRNTFTNNNANAYKNNKSNTYKNNNINRYKNNNLNTYKNNNLNTYKNNNLNTYKNNNANTYKNNNANTYTNNNATSDVPVGIV